MKTVISITAIFILTLPGIIQKNYAQAPDTAWTRTFGGTNIDIGHSVVQTTDLGYIIAGYTRSYGSMSGRNFMLIKTDADGYQQWINAFGGNDDDEAYSVKQTSDGGYIIAGHTKSFGAGNKDVLLIRTDADGNQIWLKTYGGPQDDEGYSVLQTSDGGFVVAGVTSSFGAGGRDVYLIKTDPLGNVEWTRTLGGMSSDGAWSIVQTADGGFALAGWTFSHGPGPLGNAWLVKTNESGNQQWHKAFGGSGVDRAHDLKQTNDGGYILTGYTSSSGAGLDDMLLIRTDSLGNAIWNKTFGGSGRDYGQSVVQTDDGGFLVAGYTLSYGAGSEDMWFVKTDAEGNLLWQKTVGGSSSDVAYSVQQTADGGFIATGYTLSYGAGVHDVWLVKLAAEVTSVSDMAHPLNKSVSLQNYPNPFNTSTVVSFTLLERGFITLNLYDADGRFLKTLTSGVFDSGMHRFDIASQGLPTGVYVITLQGEYFNSTRRIIKLGSE